MFHSHIQDQAATVALLKSDAPSRARRRILIAGTVGTTIEWYDFFIYALIAPIVFDRLFFPKFDQLTATMAVFATFAVGFFARPLGGLVFGHFGDRVGRKSVLLTTLVLMGSATMLIGLLPTYEDADALATTALVMLRFLQGFALGGESTAASLLAIESAPSDKRGFAAAIIQAAGPFGVVLAAFAAMAVTRLSEADLLSWGWRVPFLASGVLVGIGIYIRLRIEESATFREVSRRAPGSLRPPSIEALRTHARPILVIIITEMAQTSFFYLTAILSLSLATHQLGVPTDGVTQAVLYANLVALTVMPLLGALCDRFGRKRLLLIGLSLSVASMFAFYEMLATQDTGLVMTAIVATVGLIHPIMFSAVGSYYPELFPTRIRFSGVSIGKQTGTVLGGGLAPLIATALYAASGETLWIVGYYAALGVAALFALTFLRETKNDPISY